MPSLVIGGTRNLGPSIVRALLDRGHQVSVLNRGQTADDLPREVERLRADRSDRNQLKQALGRSEFDLVVDTTLYNGPDAEAVAELLGGRVGRYVFLSTGQVYLIRVGLQRPFREPDYEGPVRSSPPESDVSDYQNWLYGFEKRAAEDVFARAWTERRFPFTSLRLPIVNSERDHYHRLYGYFLRIKDGGPVLIPEDEGLPLRHVYGEDVAQAIVRVLSLDGAQEKHAGIEDQAGRGQAFNISQEETVSLQQFLERLAEIMSSRVQLVRLPRAKLEREGLLPACSRFSGKWMSSLDNQRSKKELGMVYTSLETYLSRLVGHFESAPPVMIEDYQQRAKELEVAHERK
jgi:nucleoside-diphosphate-sugar epimerase